MSFKKIYIYTLILVLMLSLICINVSAADSVIHSFTYVPTGFRLGSLNNPLENYTLYDYSSTTYPFIKYSTAFNLGRASYRYYVDYKINNDFSLYVDSQYILLSCTVALNTNLTNNSRSYFYFYKADGTIYKSQIIGDRTTEVITIDFQSVDLNVYSNFLILQVDDITDFAENVSQVSYNHYFETLDTVNQAFLMSPLTIDVYDDINDVIDSINTSVDIIKKQNDVIINNLDEVNEKLDTFINSGPDNSVEESFDNKVVENNSIHNSFNDLENSYMNDVESGLNNDVSYNTSEFKSYIDDVVDSPLISSFFIYLYSNPFIVVCFTVLPLFWISYILIYRG